METSLLICGVNQWTVFYMITASVMNGLKCSAYYKSYNFIKKESICYKIRRKNEGSCFRKLAKKKDVEITFIISIISNLYLTSIFWLSCI